MKSKIVLCAAVAALALGAQEAAPPKSGDLAPLIRRDLIPAAVREFPPLKRDLFSAQVFVPGAKVADTGPGYVTSPPEKREPEETSRPVFALRYVGFVQNRARTKFVGLVMFEGQFLAVEEGDAVGPGWKVRRLTAQEIEVEGPDGTTQVFAFEGEIR